MGIRDVVAEEGVRELAATIVALVRSQRLSVAAAGVAYYAFNALLPTLVLVVLAASASGQVGVAAERVARLANVSTQTVGVVENAVQEGEGAAQLAVLAGLVATWSTLSLGRAVSNVFRDVYSDVDHTPLERAADVIVVFLTWVAAVLLVLVVGILLALVEQAVVVTLGWPLVLFVALLVVLLPMYLVFPPSVSLREALPGTALAAAAWTGSAMVFNAYAARAVSVRLFGLVGVVLLVLTWLYVGSLALVAGAATNAVLADRLEDTQT
jgi:membrane protein